MVKYILTRFKLSGLRLNKISYKTIQINYIHIFYIVREYNKVRRVRIPAIKFFSQFDVLTHTISLSWFILTIYESIQIHCNYYGTAHTYGFFFSLKLILLVKLILNIPHLLLHLHCTNTLDTSKSIPLDHKYYLTNWNIPFQKTYMTISSALVSAEASERNDLH